MTGRYAIDPICLHAALVPGHLQWSSSRAPRARPVPTSWAADTFTLDAPSYTAHENQGTLTITIERSGDLAIPAVVRYGVKQQTATDGQDFVAIPNSDAVFLPGQRTFTIQVPIIDRGQNSPPLTALAYLYGPSPGQLGANSNSPITIQRDDPLDPRDNANPLALPTAPADGNVLEGVPFYVAGTDSAAGQAAAQLRNSNPTWADALSVIANAPGSRRFYMWNEPDPAPLVAGYLEGTQVAQPGTTVQLTTYSLVHGHCTGSWSDSPGDVARFQNWINGLAQGIGNFHVALFFEIDSTITNGCLSAQGSYVRMHDELAWAVNRLEQDPHLALYLDGGAADALSVAEEARLLNQAGVHQAQGFFVNATHFDWTSRELYYAQQISKLLGGVHFVVNTGTSGQGPLVPANKVHDGNEVLCNPAGRGLVRSRPAPAIRAPTPSCGSTTRAARAASACPGRRRPRPSGPSTPSAWSSTARSASPDRSSR